jgi:tetratricopeptide (TPR) repeat protein
MIKLPGGWRAEIKPSLSNLSVCYEAVQRVYRNAVLSYVRKRLKTAGIAEFNEKVQAPFKREWAEIAAAAQERRLTGEVSNELIDDLDILGVNHFYNLFEAYYSYLIEEPKDTHHIQAKSNKQALLGWAKAVKNLRDPVSHPSASDFSFEDSFAMLDPARRILLRLQLQEAADEVKAWMQQLTGLTIAIDTTTEPLEDRLPAKESIIVDFVGRAKELEALEGWLDDPNTRRWALAGEGGKGKSAIAYRFATKVKYLAPEPYQLVMWISAKRRRFDEGSVVDIKTPDFTDMSSALEQILNAYGWDEFNEQTLAERKAKVLELLDNFPAVLIVDDADSLEGQSEDAVEFFSLSVPQTRTKVLLTSRRVLFGMGNTTTHVSGLEGQDAADFISSRCRLTELDINIIRPHTAEILKITEGSPLYIEDLLRLCAIMPVGQALAAWKERSGDIAREYALGRELDLLSPRARQVLAAACVPSKPVSHDELGAMTGLSFEELSSSVRELQKLFLVPKPALFEGEERFNVNLNTRLLVRKSLGRSDLYRRIEQAYKNLTKGAESTHDELVSAAIRRANVLVRAREIDSAESTLKSALNLRPNQPNLLGFLGWVYKASIPRRVTDARENFERAAQLGCKNLDMFRHWCEMELDQKEWARAAFAAERGIELVGKIDPLLYFAGYARCRLGREFQSGLHSEKAQDELLKARKWLTQALSVSKADESRSQPTSDTYRALVLVLESLKATDELLKYFREWFATHPEHPDAQTEWTRISAKFKFEQSVIGLL